MSILMVHLIGKTDETNCLAETYAANKKRLEFIIQSLFVIYFVDACLWNTVAGNDCAKGIAVLFLGAVRPFNGKEEEG